MGRISKARLTAAVGVAALLGAVAANALPAWAAGSGSPALHAGPKAKLSNMSVIRVFGSHFIPGDEIILLECQRTASLIIGCDPVTATPVKVTAEGKILPTSFTVMTGVVGTGTCGTSKTDAKDCSIEAEDPSGLSNSLDAFAGGADIAFAVSSSTTPTIPPIPTPTIPTTPSTTLPSLPVPTLPTTSTTLPAGL
jgi:hypothetical protein